MKKTRKNKQLTTVILSIIMVILGLMTGIYVTQHTQNLYSLSYEKKQDINKNNYLHSQGTSTNCPASSSQGYQTMGTYKPRLNPDTNPEININLRSYTEVNQKPELVHYGGDTDPIMPPNFGTLFPQRLPSIVKTYSVYQWDYANNKRGSEIEKNWPVNLVGLFTVPGEPVVAPKAGRDIGGGHVLMVLYATENTIVFTHSTSDLYTDEQGNFSSDGYLIYVDDICIDTNLLAAYNRENASGRGSLPVLATGQIFGYGKGIDIKVGIRDSLDWMDPRAQKDWWQGFDNLPAAPSTNISTPPTMVPPTLTIAPAISPTTVLINTPTKIPYIQPTNILPSPSIQILQPTTNNPPPTQQPSTIPTPTITPIPTPTKTLSQKIIGSPAFNLLKNISSQISEFLKIVLP